ncbi:hypothetical protein BDK51DRAFT_40836 [Blyttiomyces helicus]|uniref:Uncharacterized protein n=1 Tax=Blyttiomyces helicus TaxID=388810 RepID=A0A4P9VW64_9FUNG|nr:hypothetical protein BDK51DRAFT_40836 [Blyttiomyces helicus]|eukprot:RKO83382.1 hypothetical protein BDK51DRAFT_40836 [Blyttiomyces helicus]
MSPLPHLAHLHPGALERPSFYEVLTSRTSARMYLDLELKKTATPADVAAIERRMAEVYPKKSIEERTCLAEDYVYISSVDFDEGFAQKTLQLVHATLLTFLKPAFPQCYGRNNSKHLQALPEPHYLYACWPNKLSFHVVVPQSSLISTTHQSRSPFGSSINFSSTPSLKCSTAHWYRLVVQRCMNLHKMLKLKQSKWYPSAMALDHAMNQPDTLLHVTRWNYPRPAGLQEYSTQHTAARPASSFQGTRASRPTASGKAADLACKMIKVRREAGKCERLAFEIEPISTFLSDVEKWVLENLEVVPMHEFIQGQVVFHEACEGLYGTPSALFRHGHDKNRLVYCFSCNMAIFKIPTWRPVS